MLAAASLGETRIQLDSLTSEELGVGRGVGELLLALVLQGHCGHHQPVRQLLLQAPGKVVLPGSGLQREEQGWRTAERTGIIPARERPIPKNHLALLLSFRHRLKRCLLLTESVRCALPTSPSILCKAKPDTDGPGSLLRSSPRLLPMPSPVRSDPAGVPSPRLQLT